MLAKCYLAATPHAQLRQNPLEPEKKQAAYRTGVIMLIVLAVLTAVEYVVGLQPNTTIILPASTVGKQRRWPAMGGAPSLPLF